MPHSHTRQGTTRQWIGSSQRPLPENTQKSQQTDIHVPGGIRTRNPSKLMTSDPRPRPRGHWDRPLCRFKELNVVSRFCHLCFIVCVCVCVCVCIESWWGKPEGKKPLRRPRRRWMDNIRTDLQEVGCGYMDWIGWPRIETVGRRL